MVEEKCKRLDHFSQSLEDVIKIKVVVIGDVSVGKTSLATRFTKDLFEEKITHTIGASYYVRTVTVGDKRIVFQIWDTAGQERFRSLVPMYLRDTKIAIMMYDITSVNTFGNLDHWKKELCSSAPVDAFVALVGNKCDLHADRKVETKDGKEYANRHGMLFTETSAKLGTNIEDLFHDLGVLVAENSSESSLDKSSIELRKTHIIPIENTNFRQMSKRRCCSS